MGGVTPSIALETFGAGYLLVFGDGTPFPRIAVLVRFRAKAGVFLYLFLRPTASLHAAWS